MCTDRPEDCPEKPPGPVFVSGRQHSGNTVVSLIFARIPGCFAIDQEGIFFDHRTRLDRTKDPVPRARWIASNLKLRSDELTRQAIDHLSAWARQHRDADALAQYLEVMRYLTATTGNRFWQQKATGYIFHGRQVLTSIPDSRMVYLIRNPYDVSASLKRRAPWHERIVGWGISWNKGLAIAHRLEQDFPGRVHLLRYEHLVSQPQQSVAALCEFVGVPFDPSYLDVPHVNPAEAMYQVVDGPRGLNTSRLYYYVDRLSPAEIAALDLVVSRRWIEHYYPNLPHRSKPRTAAATLGGFWLVALGPFHYGWTKLRIGRNTQSGPFIERMLRRLLAR